MKEPSGTYYAKKQVCSFTYFTNFQYKLTLNKNHLFEFLTTMSRSNQKSKTQELTSGSWYIKNDTISFKINHTTSAIQVPGRVVSYIYNPDKNELTGISDNAPYGFPGVLIDEAPVPLWFIH